MIDYDRFWTERGTSPGTSSGIPTITFPPPAGFRPFDPLDIPGMNPGPGRTPEQIAECERELGVRLPEVLRQAYARQDGGFVRDTEFRVFPLDEIAAPEDDFWEFACFDDGEEPDRELFFEFAEDDLGGRFFLCYSAGDTEAEPAVFVYFNDPGNASRCGKSVEHFFEKMLKTDNAPSVDWSETAALKPIARETIDLSRLFGGPAEEEQILAQVGGALVLYVHRQTQDSETYTKTTLQLPLDASAARLEQRSRPGVSTYTLALQPENTDAIFSVDSRRTSGGAWKNTKSQGVPIYVQFESTDRDRLQALRQKLLGKGAARRADGEEARQRKLEESMASLSPDERHSAMMQLMMQMRGRPGGMPATDAPLPPGAPPEAVALQEMLQKKLREIEERARGHIAKFPVDPTLLAQMGENFPGMPQPPGPAGQAPDDEEEPGEG
jgi:hypothetical protein